MAELVRDLDHLGQSLFEPDVYHAVTLVSVLDLHDGFKSHDACARERVGKKFKTSSLPKLPARSRPSLGYSYRAQ